MSKATRFFAMENEVVENALEQEVELPVEHPEIEEHSELVNQGSEAVDSLVHLQEVVAKTDEIAPVEAELIEVAMESIYNRIGYKRTHSTKIAIENFKNNKKSKTDKVALEAGIVESVKKILKKIWEFIVKIKNHIADFFKSFFSKTKIVESQIKEASKRNVIEENSITVSETGIAKLGFFITDKIENSKKITPNDVVTGTENTLSALSIVKEYTNKVTDVLNRTVRNKEIAENSDTQEKYFNEIYSLIESYSRQLKAISDKVDKSDDSETYHIRSVNLIITINRSSKTGNYGNLTLSAIPKAVLITDDENDSGYVIQPVSDSEKRTISDQCLELIKAAKSVESLASSTNKVGDEIGSMIKAIERSRNEDKEYNDNITKFFNNASTSYKWLILAQVSISRILVSVAREGTAFIVLSTTK